MIFTAYFPHFTLLLEHLLEHCLKRLFYTFICTVETKKEHLKTASFQRFYSYGDKGSRTPDLFTASEALSQLSYAPKDDISKISTS